MKPLLKWAGNKFKILDKILPELPPSKRLIEPFTGSAAVFLNTRFKKYTLGEANADLINLYQQLQSNGPAFISYAKRYFKPQYNQREQYYTLRQRFNCTQNARLRAALFVYLNRHGFNGLCRYNRSGIFNVPFGQYKNPCFPTEAALNFIEKAQHAEFIHADFVTVMQKASRGDVIYCDPPYVPLNQTSNFTQYHCEGFNFARQKELAELARQLAKNKNISVIISNHDTAFTRELYHDAKIKAFEVPRYISCKPENRRPAPELLALYYP